MALLGLPQANAIEQIVRDAASDQRIPDPMHEIFGGGANASKGVEIVVIHPSLFDGTGRAATLNRIGELLQNRLVDDSFEILEIHHHAIARLAGSLDDRP